MRAVGIKQLKNRLSEYVRLASNGEVVLVTDHDRVVAELIAPRLRAEHIPDALVADVVRKGWLTPAVGREAPLPERRPVASTSEILEGLARDREESS